MVSKGDAVSFEIMRELCLGCRRAKKVCWCDRLEPFECGFQLELLMHPRESRITIGTGRMVHRFVQGSRLWVGASFDDDHPIWQALREPAVVLFPGPEAIDLDRLNRVDRVVRVDTPGPSAPGDPGDPLARRATEDHSTGSCRSDVAAATSDDSIFKNLVLQDKPLTLIVVDGTWSTARRVLYDSPRLMALPRVAFTPTTRARYDAVRKEPSDACVSTLEAVHALIDHFDRLGLAKAPNDRAHDRMLTLLDALVHEQVAFVPALHLENRHQRAPRGQREARGPVTR